MTNPNVTTRGMTQQASASGFKSSEVLIDLQEMFSVYPPTADAEDFVRFCVDRSVEVGDIDSRDHLRESGKMMAELQDPNLRREILPLLGDDYRSWLAVKDDSQRVSQSGWLE